jgi:gas vesicle protein
MGVTDMRFLVGFILGVGIGAAVVLLMAPQPGNVMRQLIACKARGRCQARQEQEAEGF